MLFIKCVEFFHPIMTRATAIRNSIIVHAQTHARTPVCTHAYTHTQTPAQLHTPIPICTHMNMHTHAHTHIHTHTCSYTHVHMYTHTQERGRSIFLFFISGVDISVDRGRRIEEVGQEFWNVDVDH